ncbi:MAG: cytochrome c [Bacteroidetes bacterium]|nr:cytochrome c [Bacteroidota bacterium]
MNQSKKQLVELAVIILFILGISALIWNITPYSSMPARVAPTTGTTADATPATANQVPADKQWSHGRELFKNNCASCHNPKVAQTGPALIGVTKRWEDGGSYQGKTGKQWLYAWIKNWHDPVDAKYPYAVGIQNYSPSFMNTFTNLKDEDIDAILHYVETPAVAQALP